MSSYVLLDVVRIEQAQKLREAERARLLAIALRTDERPSILKSLMLALVRS